MCLLLILFWCSAVVRGWGVPKILGENSRFGEFNSRLGRREFPFALLREFARKGLIYLAVFAAKMAGAGENRRNSRFVGKNREFCPTGRTVRGAAQIVSTNIPTEGWIGGPGTDMAILNRNPESPTKNQLARRPPPARRYSRAIVCATGRLDAGSAGKEYYLTQARDERSVKGEGGRPAVCRPPAKPREDGSWRYS